MPSSTVENYLKTIHFLSDGLAPGERVAVGKIAEHLGLTPGTATTMMKHLEQAGFIDYAPRKGVMLTTEGRGAARDVLRRHRLIELFLVEVMKLDWSQVHEEAEILEHAFSDRLIERIDEMLGRPSHDPHGDPIPDRHGIFPAQQLRMLAHCEPGEYTLIRVTREDPAFLRWLDEHGLIPGAHFTLLSKDDLAGALVVRTAVKPDSFPLGLSHSAALWVA